jgi:hypothetical protein
MRTSHCRGRVSGVGKIFHAVGDPLGHFQTAGSLRVVFASEFGVWSAEQRLAGRTNLLEFTPY